MADMISTLNELYIRFMVWLGAAPPPGYEYLLGSEAGPVEYTLKEGDTLFSVARRFGVHHELIAKANDLEDPGKVQPGQTLIIPPADWDPATSPLLTQGSPTSQPALESAVLPATDRWPSELSEQHAPEVFPEAPAISEPVTAEAPLESAAPLPELEWLMTTEQEPSAELTVETSPPPESTLLPTELPWLVTGEPAGAPLLEVEEAETISPPDRTFVEVEPVAPVDTLTPVEEVAEPVLKPEQQPPEQDMVFRYEIQRGDTLNAIARRYGLTVKQLVEANHITDSDRIFPGQKLVIPGYMPAKPQPPQPEVEAEIRHVPPPAPEMADFFIYTVSSGDTFNLIAKRYGVTVRQLIEANQIENPELIRVGQRLVIPGVIKPPESRPEQIIQPEFQPQPEPSPAVDLAADFRPYGSLDAIRAVYVSYFAIGHTDFRQRIFDLLDTTELNAVVIDAKGDFGWISYPTHIPLAHEIGAARPTAKDFEAILAQLKERGVYTIARVVTFKDNPLAHSYPELAVKLSGSTEIWQDRDQLSWSDPFLKPVWDYNIQVAVEAAQLGFDEIQFDYLRFPTSSQGGTPQFSREATKETRTAAITEFLSIVRGQLQPFGVKVAAGTFGYTCWRKDDTLIGQDIDRLGQYLDVLCPMLAPSTFGNGVPGYKNAIAHPYEVVYYSTQRAVARVAQFGCAVRPWIQDFPDYRFDQRVYGRAEIQAQIKGCFDAGASGFMVWDPQVKYSDGAYAPITDHS